jgi:hypothetical protein
VYRGFAVAMFTTGQSYSFYVSPLTVRGFTRNMFSGFFAYTGVTQQSRDGAKAIAADALALAFANGRCSRCAWAKDKADAIALIGAASAYLPVPTWHEAAAQEEACQSLREGAPNAACPPLVVPARSTPPEECQEAFQLFRRHVGTWASAGL